MRAPGLLLDTSVLISLERNILSASNVIKPGYTILIASVVYAEMLVGFSLDKNPKRATVNRANLDELLKISEVVNFSIDDAESYSEIMHFMKVTGTKRTPIDTMLAAIAKSQNATILTHDRAANFAGLPGVKVEEV